MDIFNSHSGDIVKIGKKLARKAHDNSLNNEYDSPYSKAARAEGWVVKIVSGVVQEHCHRTNLSEIII